MKRKIFLIVFISFFTLSIFSQSIQQFVNIGDFKLINDEIIKDCKIGFRTLGTLNEDKSNVIIYCSWFEGTSEAIGNLIEKKNFVDTSKFYIVAFDALGNGVSSSPSNYENSCFPEITVRDMVNAQHVLLTKHLGLNHIYGAIGGSMGSMQVFEWAVAHPNYIDKIVAYVSTPKMTSYDLLWMNTQLKIIETSKKYGASEKEIKTITNMMTALFARTPDYVNENVKLDEFQPYLSSFENKPLTVFTVDNYVAQMKAMMKHDISKYFNSSMEEAAKHIQADLFIIISKNDLMVNPSTSVKLAEMTSAKLLVLENNCGHLAVGCELDRCREEINNFFEK